MTQLDDSKNTGKLPDCPQGIHDHNMSMHRWCNNCSQLPLNTDDSEIINTGMEKMYSSGDVMELDENLFMILEQYKEAIKFLHHTIKDKGLTPDEILEREDVFTNSAKSKLTKYIEEEIKKAVRLTWNKSGEGYNGEYPITWKDGTIIEEVVVEEVLGELRGESNG